MDQLVAEIGPTIAAQRAFEAGLDVIGVRDAYVVLDVARGAAALAALHDQVHDVLVDAAATRRHPYRPHMTLGRLSSATRAKEVAAGLSLSLEATAASVTFCRIGATNVDRLISIDLAARARR